MNLIVAVDKEWGVDKGGGLLAHLPEDMKHFGETTSDRTVVMGRRAPENFPGGRPLKNRVNMILSRNESYSLKGVQIYHRAEDMLETLKDYNGDDVFIISGGMIYREFLPYYNRAYVTCIHRTFEVGTDFGSLDQDESWKLESVSDGREHEGVSLEFGIYRRVR